MDTENLNEALYHKVSAEQEKYRDWLMEQPPANILLHSVEYVGREEILMELKELLLPDEQARALLASPDTMADIYQTYSQMADTGHMDVIRESIEEQANTLIKNGILSQPDAARQEGVYLVDRASLLHLKEVQGGDFEYAVFNKQTREKVTEGRIIEDRVLDGIDPTHDYLASARDAAIEEAGLDGIEVSQVGLTSLKDFPTSDIRRRSVWEPETLPKDDIHFINSDYKEQFRIPDGGTIQVEYPDRTFSTRCEYIDDYHTRIGSEVYHICQFAEILERGGGVCRPEPELETDQAAWKIGWRAYLAVECGAGQWNYHLFDDKMAELKSGELEVIGCSINEVRDMILMENKMGHHSMTPTDYGLLMEKAAQMGQEHIGQNAAAVHKSSIRSQLAEAKAAQAEKPAVQQHQKDKDAR